MAERSFGALAFRTTSSQDNTHGDVGRKQTQCKSRCSHDTKRKDDDVTLSVKLVEAGIGTESLHLEVPRLNQDPNHGIPTI